MRKTLSSFAALAAMAALSAAVLPVRAATTTPDATTMLFDANHLAGVAKGDALVYRLERVVTDPKMLGEPFADDIRVDIVQDDPSGTREVSVKVFTGERGRPEQKITGMTGNPVLVVFLDRVVNNLSMLAGGNRPYLKQRVKMGLANGAKVDAVEIDFKGKPVKGNRITVTPFVGDPNALKMMGYDGVKLEIVVSDMVPGHLVAFTSVFESPTQGSPRLEERIRLEGAGAIK